jgi:hypothetical protein
LKDDSHHTSGNCSHNDPHGYPAPGPFEETRERTTLQSILLVQIQIPQNGLNVGPVHENNRQQGSAMNSDIKNELRVLQAKDPLG